jgi:hypothetical protein
MTNWKRFMMAASGGSNEFVLIGDPYTSGYYAWQNAWSNYAVPGSSGKLTVWRRLRANNTYSTYIEQYNPDLSYVTGNVDQLSGAASTETRFSVGWPKIVVDESKGYNMVGPADRSTYNWPFSFMTFGTGASPYGTNRQTSGGSAYPSNSWFQSKLAFCYTIGNDVYAGTGDNTYGGGFGSWDFTQSTNNVQNPGVRSTSNSTPGRGGFVDGFPVNASSPSTNHVLCYGSNFDTTFYELNSSFSTVGNIQVTGENVLQYASNMAYDSTNDTVFMFNSNTQTMTRYDRGANSISKQEIELPNSSSRLRGSCSLYLVNGYLYLFYAHRDGSVLIKMDPSQSNLSTGYSAKRFAGPSTLETEHPFAIPGPNSATGETDLLYLGFNFVPSGVSSSYKAALLAVCTFDNASLIADYSDVVVSNVTNVIWGNPYTPSQSTGPGLNNMSHNPSLTHNNFNSFFYQTNYAGMQPDGPYNL